MPYKCATYAIHNDSSRTHSCVVCGVSACKSCNDNLNSTQHFICHHCAGNIKRMCKIPDDFLKKNVRTNIEGNVGNDDASNGDGDILTQDNTLTQEESQGLPCGQESPRKKSEDENADFSKWQLALEIKNEGNYRL